MIGFCLALLGFCLALLGFCLALIDFCLALLGFCLALTAVDLFLRPELVVAARTELMERRGAGFEYAPLLGDREPPLDYRK